MISVNIHPHSFSAVRADSGSAWVHAEAGDSYAEIFLTPELCDELIEAAAAAKQLLAAGGEGK